MVDLNFKMKENDETYQHKLYEADEKYQLMLVSHKNHFCVLLIYDIVKLLYVI